MTPQRETRNGISVGLRETRFAAGLTQKKLAELAGVSRFTISNYETGHSTSLRLDTYDALASVLGDFDANVLSVPITPGDGDPRHGSADGYINHRCKCPACRAAWAIYHKERGYSQRYRDKHATGPCLTPSCPRKRDRAKLTGYCARCNVALGLKKPPRRA